MNAHRILVLDTHKTTNNHYIALAIRDAFEKVPGVECVVLASYRTAIEDFRTHNCNLLVALGGAGAELPVLARLTAMAEYSVLWTTEDPYELTSNVSISDHFDLVFSNDLNSVSAYKGRAKHLPFAASTKYHDYPVLRDDSQYLYDVLFIGTAWPNRVEIVNNFIASVRRDIKVKVALPYNEFLPRPKLHDGKAFFNWRTSAANAARMANRSRIVLGLYRNFSTSNHDASTGSTPPPRIFETALAGGFQLLIGSNDEISRYYAPGKDLCVTDDAYAAARVAEHYLTHPDERIAIAHAARNHTEQQHTYEHRVSTILGEIAKLRPRAINSALVPNRQRSHVLMVTHNMQGVRPGGGVEVYQELLASQIAHTHEVLFLYPDRENNWIVRRRGGRDIIYTMPPFDSTNAISDPLQEITFERILIEHKIDVVHFQHLIGYALSLPLISRALGVPSVYTVHDFYLICSHFNLISYNGSFCDVVNTSRTACEMCMAAEGKPKGAAYRRANFVRTAIDAIDLLIANTPWSKAYVKNFHHLPDKKITVLEMMMSDMCDMTTIERKESIDAELIVIVPGNFTDIKGADAMIRLFNATRNEQIKFNVIGSVGDAFADIIRNLRLDHVNVRGGYTTDDLPKLLSNADVSLHMSIWPETYSISLSEVFSAGVVPIATDIGAHSERIHHLENGIKVPVRAPELALDWLRRLKQDRILLRQLQTGSSNTPLQSPEAHSKAMLSIYASLIHTKPVVHDQNSLAGPRDYQMRIEDLGIRINSARWTDETVEWDQSLTSSHDESVRIYARSSVDLLPSIGASNGSKIHMDSIAVDMRQLGHEESVVVTKKSTVHCAGWAYAVDQGRGAEESFLVFTNEDNGLQFSFRALQTHRADVSDFFGVGRDRRLGFEAAIALNDIAEGRYRLELAQRYGDRSIRHQTSMLLIVGLASAALVNSYTRVRQPVKLSMPTAAKWIQRPQDGKIDTINGSNFETSATVKQSEKTIEITGWAADLSRGCVADKVELCLLHVKSKEIWSCVVDFVARPDVALHFNNPMLELSGFRVTIDISSIPSGQYVLCVNHKAADGTFFTVAGTIEVISGNESLSNSETTLGENQICAVGE